jgi:hypothetical protein
MTRLITKAALLSACGMLVAVAAMAGIPTAGNSTSPAFIRMVQSASSVPDSVAGKFTVTVRDIANNTIANSFVTVDFSGCTDVKVAANQLNANYTTNCTNKTVSAYTNAAGLVGFTLLGSSGAGVATGLSCAKIQADGVQLSTPTVAVFDLSGLNGVDGSDGAIALTDFGLHVYRGRDDFDGNALFNGADLSVWLTEYGTHKSAVTNTICP